MSDTDDQSRGSANEKTRGRVPQRVPWGVIEGFAAVGAFILVQGFFGPVVRLWQGPENLQIYAAVPSFLVGGLVLWVLLRHWCKGRMSWNEAIGLVAPRRKTLKSLWRPVVGSASLYFIALVVTILVAARLRVEPPVQELARSIRSTTSPQVLLLACIVTVGLVPLVEETLFRGMLYLPLRQRFGVWPSVVVVSLLFAYLHQYPFGFAQLFVLSGAFIWLFEHTGSLWVPIFAHSVYNAVNLLLVRM